MGYRHTPAQLGGHGETFGARGRLAEALAPRSFEQLAARKPVGEISGRLRDRATACAEAKPWTARGLLLLVRFYLVFLSPFFGGACKFYPSCSNYAAEAIARHGARRGLVLALKRLLRCHPFTRGGVDLVPDPGDETFGALQRKPFLRHGGSERAL